MCGTITTSDGIDNTGSSSGGLTWAWAIMCTSNAGCMRGHSRRATTGFQERASSGGYSVRCTSKYRIGPMRDRTMATSACRRATVLPTAVTAMFR